MKHTWIATGIALVFGITTAYAATPVATQTTPHKTTQAWHTQNAQATQPKAQPASDNPSNPKPPLNQYGAVDVNADVPANVQVPPAPENFKPHVIKPEVQVWSNLVPAAPILNAKSYLLMDANTGRILVAYNANQRVAPASLTKLMLLYISEKELVAGRIHLNDELMVPTISWATGGSRMFLKPGMQVTVQQLIPGIIVDSGNDAAVTLARHIAGTQQAFVSMMNHEAKRLGMTNTHFTDVMGLPAPYHFSSAHDMGVLAHAIVEDFPQYLPWFKKKSYTFNHIKQANFNKLLFIYPYADGLKTGSTDVAGYSLVSTAKQPHNPMRLIGVVMGAPSPMASATQSKALLTYGFRFFKSRLMYTAGQTIQQAKVYFGAKQQLAIGVEKDLYATYPNNPGQTLSAKLELRKVIKAPIKKGQVLGKVVVTLNGKLVTSAPVVALEADAKGSWWRRSVDHVKLWF